MLAANIVNEDIVKAFNSLSRDHKDEYKLLSTIRARGRFQLPLSGSLIHSSTSS